MTNIRPFLFFNFNYQKESSPTVLKSIEKLINEKIKYALNNLSKLKRYVNIEMNISSNK